MPEISSGVWIAYFISLLAVAAAGHIGYAREQSAATALIFQLATIGAFWLLFPLLSDFFSA